MSPYGRKAPSGTEPVTVLRSAGLHALNMSLLVGQGRKRRGHMKRRQASRNSAWVDIDLLWVEQVSSQPFP